MSQACRPVPSAWACAALRTAAGGRAGRRACCSLCGWSAGRHGMTSPHTCLLSSVAAVQCQWVAAVPVDGCTEAAASCMHSPYTAPCTPMDPPPSRTPPHKAACMHNRNRTRPQPHPAPLQTVSDVLPLLRPGGMLIMTLKFPGVGRDRSRAVADMDEIFKVTQRPTSVCLHARAARHALPAGTADVHTAKRAAATPCHVAWHARDPGMRHAARGAAARGALHLATSRHGCCLGRHLIWALMCSCLPVGH
jgi:hypothetical protein